MTFRIISTTLAFCGSLCGAPFLNLDFEAPRIDAVVASNNLYGFARVSDAVPGWALTIGNASEQLMLYNNVYLGSAGASLQQSSSLDRGKYSFVMTAGPLPSNSSGPVFSSSLFQTGTVPADSRSLLFDAGVDFGTLDVYLRGGLSPIVDLNAGPKGLRTYGVDVAAWSGSETELRFTINPGSSFTFGAVILDNLRFSPNALPIVPEPSTWALLGAGLAAVVWVSRSPSRRKPRL